MTKRYYRANFFSGNAKSVLSSMSKQDWEVTDSASHFFLSRLWVESWLSTLPDAVTLIVARVTDICIASGETKTVALAIFGASERRFLWRKKIQWHLFRTGREELDQIWLENNKILALPGYSDAERFLFDRIAEMKNDIEIKMAVLSDLPEPGDKWLLKIEKTEMSRLYEKTSNKPHLHPGLKKKLNAMNKLSLSIDVNEISRYEAFAELLLSSPWHVEKWQNTDTPSGFVNVNFVRFHQALFNVDGKSETVRPRVFSLSVGGIKSAVLYGFQHDSWFGFYCLCQAPQPDNRLRIGLYFHSVLQEKLFDEGVSTYDFMAGDDEYKKMLSNSECQAFQICLYKPSANHSIESVLRKVKKVALNVLKQMRLT